MTKGRTTAASLRPLTAVICAGEEGEGGDGHACAAPPPHRLHHITLQPVKSPKTEFKAENRAKTLLC